MRHQLLALLALLSFAAPTLADSPSPQIHEALAEVNATRARRGLRPFIFDEGLTRAAMGCAKFRAERLIEGHYRDFSALPPGCHASAAGCGAATDGWGWLTCCTYDSYRFAGAAWVRGRDNQHYMHLFVR